MSSSDEEIEVAGGYDDWEEGSEDEAAQSLFTDQTFPDSTSAIAYDAAHQGFDLAQFRHQRRLNEYDVIKVINYIRSEVAAGRDPRAVLHSKTRPAPWDADDFLQPVLQNDALLMYEFHDDEHDLGNAAGNLFGGGPATAFGEVALLREQNEALRMALKASTAGISEDARNDGNATTSCGGNSSSSDAAGLGPTPPGEPEGTAAAACNRPLRGPVQPSRGRRVSFSAAAAAEVGRVDDSYFDSYSYLDIHRDMLSDKVRTEAYRDALERNPALIRGKTVLDIGCGTAILSLFAARAGASQVVGVDGSTRIADYARRIAEANGFSSEAGGSLSIVAQKVEELEQLPNGLQQVDVLVSEWMGYALLFESMLDSVLLARDRFLKPGGAILPDLASIYVAGGGSDAGGLGFWKDVYGFDMSLLADALNEASYKDAIVATVKGEQLVTTAVAVKTLDLSTMSASNADFTSDFTLEPMESQAEPVVCRSVVVWFDVEFSSRFCVEHPVKMTTGPTSPHTHWAQALLTLREPILIQKPGAELPSGSAATCAAEGRTPAAAISGRISMARSSKHRSLDISLEYAAVAADGSRSEPRTAIYELAVSSAS